jgi:uncharacterized membrane protein
MSGFTSVLLPMVVAGMLVSAYQLSQRWGLKEQPSPLPYLLVNQTILVGMLGAVYLVAWGPTWPAQLAPGFWNAVFVATALNWGIVLCAAKAQTYKEGEASLVAPIAAMTPGLVTLIAVTLGEFPGPQGWVGVMCMTLGAWVLLSPKHVEHWWEYLGPVYRIKLALTYNTLSDIEKQRAKVVWLSLAGASLAAFSFLAVTLFIRRSGGTQGWWLAATVLWAILTVAFFLQNFLRKKVSAWPTAGSRAKFFVAATIAAACIVALNCFEYPLYAETYVAYVGTLKRLSILFTVVFGFLLFKEQEIKKRFSAAVFIVIGALLIGSEDLPQRLTDKIELFGF